MLKFEIICFLKVNNEDESFKSSASGVFQGRALYN